MVGFIGRSKELGELERLYGLGRSETCAIYGRRRTGKTTILRKFCEGKPALFITAPGRSRELTAEVVSRDASEFAGHDVDIRNGFDLFEFLRGIDTSRKTVVVIDEFPFLADFMEEVPSRMQVFIDHHLDDLNMLLVVCGSSIKAMGEHLNDSDAPLFRRFVTQMRIEPLSYPESRAFHMDLDETDRMRMYCICSGVPAYHRYMSGMDVEEAITSGFLDMMSPLREEADNLVSLELKPGSTYEPVLTAMMDGVSDIKGMVNATGLSAVTCGKAMNNLRLLGVVRREVCYGMKEKQMFVMTDGFLDFNYSVIVRNEPYDRYPGGAVAYDSMREQIQSFYGHRFEEICREYVMGTESCRRVGRWWGEVPVLENGRPVKDAKGKTVTEGVDIDLLAEVRNGSNVDLLLCECKFSHRRIGVRELETLMYRGNFVRRGDENKRYMLFSRSGFTDELLETLEDRSGLRVDLVTLEDMEEWAEGAYPLPRV